MEFVEGESLSDRLKKGPISFDEALSSSKQIADALSARHERGIVHRDLKPANIQLTPNGTVKVFDFGLAKALGPRNRYQSHCNADRRRLMRTRRQHAWSPCKPTVLMVWLTSLQDFCCFPDVTIYEKSATGAGVEVKVESGGSSSVPVHWSPDDTYIVFSRLRASSSGFDTWLQPLFGERKPIPFLESTFDRVHARVSPDSCFLAYMTNESGTFQIVVHTFPDPNAGKWQITAEGGVEPKWRRDGRELYYLSLDGKLMSVPISGPSFNAGRPEVLFQTPLTVSRASPTRDRRYDVAPDGRSLMVIPASNAGTMPFTAVVNWSSVFEK